MFLMSKMFVLPLSFQTTGLTNAALGKDEGVCIIVQGPGCPTERLLTLLLAETVEASY
jgi:hypothetical protein